MFIYIAWRWAVWQRFSSVIFGISEEYPEIGREKLKLASYLEMRTLHCEREDMSGHVIIQIGNDVTSSVIHERLTLASDLFHILTKDQNR